MGQPRPAGLLVRLEALLAAAAAAAFCLPRGEREAECPPLLCKGARATFGDLGAYFFTLGNGPFTC